MSSTRYKPERTLARGARRLPGEDRAAFRAKRRRLREHFERFNVDTSELCQWLMGLRPDGRHALGGTKACWEFFLEPATDGADEEPGAPDRLRRALFDLYAGWDLTREAEFRRRFAAVMKSFDSARAIKRTPTTKRLLERLAPMSKPHVQVLLKAAAEWVVARYQRGIENWCEQEKHFLEERVAWEKAHQDLDDHSKRAFNDIFHAMGVREKRPRICDWSRLESNQDNCEYAGKSIGKVRHGPLCIRYKEFLRAWDKKLAASASPAPPARRDGKPPKKENWQKHFEECAEQYLELRMRHAPGPAMTSLFEKLSQDFLKHRNAENAPPTTKEKLKAECEPGFARFRDAWAVYLESLGVDEPTLAKIHKCKPPHCTTFSDGTPCAFNPHTDKCTSYRQLLKSRVPERLAIERTYRAWRRDYLTGPRKPSFKYPSARTLPMPKIFGHDFFRIDWARSVVGLRLDDMPEGEFLEVGFKPWPREYSPQPADANITSVHVTFHGTRARLAFRFEVPHATSRFGVTQDELDELRSRTYPRKSQDEAFLVDARKRLLESFAGGNADTELKVLAVDLGTSGACCALFEGRKFVRAEQLKVIKRDRLMVAREEDPATKLGNATRQEKGGKGSPPPGGGAAPKAPPKQPGLSGDHVVRHLTSLETGASDVATYRTEHEPPPPPKPKRVPAQRRYVPLAPAPDAPKPATLRRHDFRRLTLHTRWMLRDWVRLNARQIVELAGRERVDLIAFESLRGYLPKGYDTLDLDQKRRLAFFSYGRIRRKVAEKAVERGMRIVTLPYGFSSQLCCRCGWRPTEEKQKDAWKKNKRKRLFVCQKQPCESLDSDENAARVLGRVFWGELQLPPLEEREKS